MTEFILKKKKSYFDLISYVEDRPGHDKKYALDSSKIKKKLNWKYRSDFNQSLELTIKWYINKKQKCIN